MARGFESKQVEQQQQAAEDRRAAARRVIATADQVEVERKRDGLLLQRTRVMREIKMATSTRHKDTLQGGLQYLEEQLASVGWKAG